MPSTLAPSTKEPTAKHDPGRAHRLLWVGAFAAAALMAVGGGTVAVAMSGESTGNHTVSAAPTPNPSRNRPAQADRPAAEAERLRLAAYRASWQARRDFARRPALARKGTPLPTRTSRATAGNPVPVGEAQRIARNMLPSFGFNPSTQFGCLVELWERESHWRVNAGSPSGAYGIPQALPGSKMATAGSDWLTNPATQIKWGLGYIKSRYQTPCGAWSAFQSRGWY